MEYDHPDVIEAVTRVREACLERDIPVMGLYGSHFETMAEMEAAIDDGYQLIGVGSDVGALRETLGTRLEASGR